MLQIVDAEIDAVVVAVSAAHGNHTPKVVQGKTILGGKVFYHLPLELDRGECTLLAEGVTGIVDEKILHAVVRIPLIEPGKVRHLVTRIAQRARSFLMAFFRPCVEFLNS